jgi:probable F420-dependent oxidoreductase
MSDVRFAAALPQLDASPAQVVEVARRAEALGFSRLWTLDPAPGGPTARSPMLDGLQLLSHAAAVTETIALGIAVIVLPNRNPVQLAKELASLDRMTAGRLVVGVGLGRKDPAAAALGFPADRRVRRLTEAIDVMRALWGSDTATYHGELWTFDDLPAQPRPAHEGGPAIWLGAGSEPALRRAARIGDAWIGAGSSSSEDFARQAPVVDAALRETGRDPAAFPMAKRVYIAVDDDGRTATERLTPILDGMYDAPGLTARVAVCGTAGHCAQELRGLVSAGAGELLLHSLYDPLEQLERLAEVARLTTG